MSKLTGKKAMTGDLSQMDRETIRNELVGIAQNIRRRYQFSPTQIRKLLHDLLDVSI